MDITDQDFFKFQELLPTILKDHKGEHALLHSGNIEGYFSSSLEAIKAGLDRFGEGRFSVQLVHDQIDDLGFFSHVNSALQA